MTLTYECVYTHLCLTLRYYGRACYDSVKNDLSSVGSHPCEKRKRWRYHGCLLCHVSVYMSLHPHSASPGFTPTLICGAPDPLLFCHPDMFNKYCLAATGYIRGVVVGLHIRWWIIRDSRLILINILKHSNTGTPTHSVRRRTSSPFSKIFFVYIFAAFFLTLFLVTSLIFFSLLPGGLRDCQRERRPPQRTPPSTAPHKSNKTRLCKYFSGSGTSSRALLLAVCWPSVWAIVCPMADRFVLCCRTWLDPCGEAAVPACM